MAAIKRPLPSEASLPPPSLLFLLDVDFVPSAGLNGWVRRHLQVSAQALTQRWYRRLTSKLVWCVVLPVVYRMVLTRAASACSPAAWLGKFSSCPFSRNDSPSSSRRP